MAEPRTQVVIRPYAPARRLILGGLMVLIGAFGLYVTYEFGRFDAGYDRLAVSQERAELEVAIERLEKANRELRTRLAELDTVRIGRSRERAEVFRTIGELQAQVARQAQELAFYRGIVAQGAATIGVKIQQLRIAATDEPERFRIRFTLVRSVRPDDTVSGTLTVRVEGEGASGRTGLDLGELTGGELTEVPFRFRYFENVDQEVALPADFRPERLMVELRSSRKDVTPLSESFAWKVDVS